MLKEMRAKSLYRVVLFVGKLKRSKAVCEQKIKNFRSESMQKKIRVVSMLLVFSMFLSMVSSAFNTAAAVEIGTEISDSGNRSQSLENAEVIEISTADQLVELANTSFSQQAEAFSKHYKLTEDIDLNEKTTDKKMKAIGSLQNPFKGIFDGGGHSIKNLEIQTNSDSSQGLFREILSEGMVKNLILNNASMSLHGDSGALAGKNKGTIQNCGLTDSTISAISSVIGGLAGINEGIIERSFVKNSVIKYSNSYSTTSYGGLAGRNGSSSVRGIIRESYTDVTVDAKKWTGGLVGWNYGTIENCYSFGEVKGTDEIGGFAGRVSEESNISNSYANTDVISSTTTGSAFLGGTYYGNGGNVQNCFYNSDKELIEINSDYADSILGKTSAELKSSGTTEALNEENSVWTVKDDINRGFPYLISNAPKDTQQIPEEKITVQVMVTPYDNQKYDFYIYGGKPVEVSLDKTDAGFRVIDVLEAGKAKLPYTSTEGKYGTFVDSMCGIKAQAPAGWMFTINDKTPDAGVSSAVVRNGDKILWYYGSPSNGFTCPKWDDLLSDEDGQASDEFDGKGTKKEPYLVKTANDFKNIIKYPKAFFRLDNPVDLKNVEFEPIGTLQNPFRGTFDGNNNEISNLTINMDEDSKNVGLFGVINNARIQNVKIINGNVTGGSRLGMLAGYAKEDKNGANFIVNCHVSGIITGLGTDVIKATRIGGLVGINDGNNTVEGTAQGSYKYSVIDNCSADVEVSCVSDEAGDVGGLVGWNRGIITDSSSSGNVKGGNTTGGLVGSNWEQIYNSHSTGNVTGLYTVGGFAGSGSQLSVMENCYSTGNVVGDKISGGNYFGGFIGSASGTVKNSLSTGTLVPGWSYNGGFAGIYNGYNIEKDIENSFGNSEDNLGNKLKGLGNVIDYETPGYEAYLKPAVTYDVSVEKLKNMFGAGVEDKNISDKKITEAEANKYRDSVIVSSFVPQGENITDSVVKLKDSQTADKNVSVIYGQKEYTGYITDSSPVGQYTLIKQNAGNEDQKTSIYLTFVKNGEFTVKQVSVTLQGNKTADKSQIEEKIKDIKSKNLIESDFTAESWSRLQAVLKEAQDVVNKAEPMQEEMKTVLFNLSAAVDNLENNQDELTKPAKIELSFPGGKQVTPLYPGGKQIIWAKIYNGSGKEIRNEKIKFESSDPVVLKHSFTDTFTAGEVTEETEVVITAVLESYPEIKSQIKVTVTPEILAVDLDSEINFLIQCYEAYMTEVSSGSTGSSGLSMFAPGAARLAGMDEEKIQKHIYIDNKNNSAYQLSQSIITLIGAGLDPAQYKDKGKTRNLVKELTDSQQTDGVNAGEFVKASSDKNSIEALTRSIIALDMAGAKYDADKAVSKLIEIYERMDSHTYKAIKTEGLILTALSNHKDVSGAEAEITKILDYLKTKQNDDGGFDIEVGTEKGKNSPTATGRVIQGLIANGINPLKDTEWMKNGSTILDAIIKSKTVKGNMKQSGYGKGEDDQYTYYEATYTAFGALIDLKNQVSMFKLLKLNDDVQPARVEIQNPEKDEIEAGQSMGLTAIVYDGNGQLLQGQALIWESSDENIAVVKDGNVEAKKSGKAAITVRISGTEIKDTILITIVDEVQTIEVSTAIIVIDKDDNYEIKSVPKTVTIDKNKHSEGLTAFGALQATTDQYSASDSGWVTSIYGINGSENGGWMFSVNGVIPEVGAKQVKLQAGEKVIWFCIYDWKKGNNPKWEELTQQGTEEQVIKALREYYSVKENFTFREAMGYNHTSDSPENDLTLIDSKFNVNENPKSATDYVGNIMGIIASGKTPYSYNGEDYVEPLVASQNEEGKFIVGEYDNYPTTVAFSMLALDMAGARYNIDKALEALLSFTDRNGSFGGVDETAMALMALSKYRERPEVSAAIEKALKYLKSQQDGNSGGFIVFGSENPYSASAVIQGLIAVGEDPKSDKWIKNGKNIVDSLMNFYKDGHFEKTSEWGTDIDMVTEQAFIALADLYRGKSMFNEIKLNTCEIVKLIINKPSGRITEGETIDLQVTAYDKNGSIVPVNEIAWTSSDAEMAAVDETGKLTAKKAGSVTITASFKNVSASVDIDIHQNEIQIEDVGDVQFKNGQQATAKIRMKNLTSESKPATLIVALYDNKTGKMLNYSIVNKKLEGNEELELSAGFLVPEEGDYSVRSFLWDDTEHQNVIMPEPAEMERAA